MHVKIRFQTQLMLQK